jgi:hypothetical protein
MKEYAWTIVSEKNGIMGRLSFWAGSEAEAFERLNFRETDDLTAEYIGVVAEK